MPLVEEVLLDSRENVLLGETFVDAPVLVEHIEGEEAVLVESETGDNVMVSSHCGDFFGNSLGSPHTGGTPLPLRE